MFLVASVSWYTYIDNLVHKKSFLKRILPSFWHLHSKFSVLLLQIELCLIKNWNREKNWWGYVYIFKTHFMYYLEFIFIFL